MEWYIILVLILVIPILLFPVAYVWYLNIGGIYALIREARRKKAAHEERVRKVAEEHRTVKEIVDRH